MTGLETSGQSGQFHAHFVPFWIQECIYCFGLHSVSLPGARIAMTLLGPYLYFGACDQAAPRCDVGEAVRVSCRRQNLQTAAEATSR